MSVDAHAVLRRSKAKSGEMVRTSRGKTVAAILTAEQHNWFLDQLDANQDTSVVDERQNDRKGSENLDDFKRGSLRARFIKKH